MIRERQQQQAQQQQQQQQQQSLQASCAVVPHKLLPNSDKPLSCW
jgi:hypothetical protein